MAIEIKERWEAPNGAAYERTTRMTAQDVVEMNHGGVRSLLQNPVPNPGSYGGNASGSPALPSSPKLRAIGYNK